MSYLITFKIQPASGKTKSRLWSGLFPLIRERFLGAYGANLMRNTEKEAQKKNQAQNMNHLSTPTV